MLREYTVQNGDTLYGIAKQFGTSVDDIKRINNLSSNVITPGQVLTIDVGSTPISYTVKKGDSLYSISKKFGISVVDLMNYNNLESTVLQIGQVLQFTPKDSDLSGSITMPVYQSYTVKKGDSLYSIAKQYGVTVDEIKSANNLKSNLLQIGQVLKIKTGEETIGIEECFGENYQEPSKEYIQYTVKKGDSLYSIAKKYNTSADNIKRLNNLTSNLLQIGQILKIKEVN